jgi:hypothetical protein
VDIEAEYGTAMVFNAMLLHSSSKPGHRRRVSCDIRFFPLCGFLPSSVHLLGPDPLGEFRRGLAAGGTETLRAPFLEAAGFMGIGEDSAATRPHSILHWADFVRHSVAGDSEAALAALTRFTNAEQGIDGVDAYAAKFLGRPLCPEPLAGLLAELRQRDAAAPEVAALQRSLAALALAEA